MLKQQFPLIFEGFPFTPPTGRHCGVACTQLKDGETRSFLQASTHRPFDFVKVISLLCTSSALPVEGGLQLGVF